MSLQVHPTALLSILDHHQRTSTNKRVVGVLLGSKHGNSTSAKNSFGVPFEEDKNVWFLDHNYLENMFALFKKINAKERIVGWYHTGSQLQENDLQIHQLFKEYCKDPVLFVLPYEQNIERKSNFSEGSLNGFVEGLEEEKKFIPLSVTVDAEEAEEIGVEHLIRDIKDPSQGNLSMSIYGKVVALRELEMQLNSIFLYLERVASGKLPVNHQIMYNLQNIFNMMPNTLENETIQKALTTFSNDSMVMSYAGSMLKGITAMHSLIDNCLSLK